MSAFEYCVVAALLFNASAGYSGQEWAHPQLMANIAGAFMGFGIAKAVWP